jgi:hypothetical protein
MSTVEIIEAIANRLSANGYRVSRDMLLPDERSISLTGLRLVAGVAASKTYFSWKGLVIWSQHIVVRTMDNARIQDIQELFEAGFRFAKRANRVPLLRGMQFGYMVIPIIVGVDPDIGLLEYISASPREHWSLAEYPVFIDSRNYQVFNFRGTALWGAFVFSDLRRVVENCVAGALPPRFNASRASIS